MMTRKRIGGQTLVTFELVQPGAHEVEIAGDFNAWLERFPMERAGEDRWRTTLDLEPGRSFEFSYLVDDRGWINDPDADDYVLTPFGSVNSIVRT